MLTSNCPSCGASIHFQSAASILLICDYCHSTLIRHDLNLEDLGKMAQLQVDGTPVQLGAEGIYRNVHFGVVGRIQLRYDQGLWNEWHLLFDDMRGGWLGEAQGNYAISFLMQVPEVVPALKDTAPGKKVQLNGKWYEIRDIQKALCIAGQGELPFRVGPGYEAPVVDLVGENNTFATIDFSEESPLVFLGEYVEFEELHLSGLKSFDGW